jgi:hypothetical protein
MANALARYVDLPAETVRAARQDKFLAIGRKV